MTSRGTRGNGGEKDSTLPRILTGRQRCYGKWVKFENNYVIFDGNYEILMKI